MPASIKTAALAFFGMAGLGVAAPLVAYQINQAQETTVLVREDRTPPPAELQQQLIVAPIEVGAVETPPVKITAKPVVRHRLTAPPQPPPPKEEAKRACAWHQSETLAQGKVWVCDTPRTSNDRPKGTFGIAPKSNRLAPRDTPSPTGFIE